MLPVVVWVVDVGGFVEGVVWVLEVVPWVELVDEPWEVESWEVEPWEVEPWDDEPWEDELWEDDDERKVCDNCNSNSSSFNEFAKYERESMQIRNRILFYLNTFILWFIFLFLLNLLFKIIL